MQYIPTDIYLFFFYFKIALHLTAACLMLSDQTVYYGSCLPSNYRFPRDLVIYFFIGKQRQTGHNFNALPNCKAKQWMTRAIPHAFSIYPLYNTQTITLSTATASSPSVSVKSTGKVLFEAGVNGAATTRSNSTIRSF